MTVVIAPHFTNARDPQRPVDRRWIVDPTVLDHRHHTADVAGIDGRIAIHEDQIAPIAELAAVVGAERSLAEIRATANLQDGPRSVLLPLFRPG